MTNMHFLIYFALFSSTYFSQEVKADCGGLIEKTNGTITSPSYPFAYPPNKRCTWEIRMPPNKRIGLRFWRFELEAEVNCQNDFVTIKSKTEDRIVREHGKFCGSQEILTIFSDTHILLIEFRSDYTVEYSGFNFGFYMFPFDCGELVEKSFGMIKSPYYPYEYPPDMNCTSIIQAPPNHIFMLRFLQFDTEESSECDYDYVTVQSKMTDGKIRDHGKFCGRVKPKLFSEGNTLLVHFISHTNKGQRGFQAFFKSVPLEYGLLLEESEGDITSPLFNFPYPPNINHTWKIQAPVNHIIQLKFTYFDTEETNECNYDYVTVKNKMPGGEIREHGKFCGGKIPPAIVSDSNTLQIQFISHTNKGHQGFKATYISEGCKSNIIEGSEGNISSPFFPDFYPPNRMCEWTILVPPQHKIKLYFLHFETEEGDGCPNDFLQIKSKSADGEIHEYGKYCGSSKPSLITTNNSLLLKFVSDRSVQRKGFKAEYFIDQLSDFESSISLESSTTPIYEPFDLTSVSQNDDITTEYITSANEKSTFADEYLSTLSPVNSSSSYFHASTDSTTVNPQTDAINGTVKNETNILTALELLTKKVSSMEDRQMQLFNNYENMFNKVGELLTPKDVSLDEKKYRSK